MADKGPDVILMFSIMIFLVPGAAYRHGVVYERLTEFYTVHSRESKEQIAESREHIAARIFRFSILNK